MINTNASFSAAGGSVTVKVRYGDLHRPNLAPSPSKLILVPEVSISLSRRQAQVLGLLVQGCSNKEIARRLNLGVGTVKIHVTAVFHKLGVTSRIAAAVTGAQLLSTVAAQPSAPPARTIQDRQEITKAYAFGPSHLNSAA